MDDDAHRTHVPRYLALGGAMAAASSAIIGLLAPLPYVVMPLLALGVMLVGAAGHLLGRRSAEPGDAPRAGYHGEAATHVASLLLIVLFILLALTELLAIPAALGHLKVFTTLGVGFVQYYHVLMGALTMALAGVVMLAAGAPAPRPMTPSERTLSIAALSVAGVLSLAGVGVGAGAMAWLGIVGERAAFVLAAALIALFFQLKASLRLPTYRDVSDWLEHNEKLRDSGLLPVLAYVLLGLSAIGIGLSAAAGFGMVPANVGLIAVGLANLTLLAATFTVGVSHIVPQLEVGSGDLQDARRKRRIILSAASIGLGILGIAVGLLTLFAFLAQVAGVAIFKALLDAFVANYLFIFALALVPIGLVVGLRTRVGSEVPYTPKHAAIAIAGGTLTLVLTFLGVFVGSGLAEGSGIEIENAVLVMGTGVLSLILFVKARTLLPSVASLLRHAISTSVDADADLQDQIRARMIATYVAGLLFVFTFVGYIVASTLGVAPAPNSSLGTDAAFFLYLTGGIALLVVVGMRYFQSVNIDPRWASKRADDEETIGKKRLTSEQVKRYLILGSSVGGASLLALVGVLLLSGAVGSIGPFDVEKKYGTDFIVGAILLGLGPYGFYQAREAKRIEAIDARFPEFLRDLAESQRAGMTLTEAVLTAAKGDYGMLTGEIRKMAVQIEWGVAFSDALERFAHRVDTPLINRTVSLVVEASNAGGSVVDVLTAASDDAREIQQIVKERKQSMSIYVMIIYIAFAVFVGVIAVLNAQFIPEVAKAVEGAEGVSIGGLNFQSFDPEEFKTLFFHAAIIQGLGGGIVGGVMANGKPIHGLRHSFVLVFISWVLFRLVIG